MIQRLKNFTVIILAAILLSAHPALTPSLARAEDDTCSEMERAQTPEQVARLVRHLHYLTTPKLLPALERLHECGTLAAVSAHMEQHESFHTPMRTAILAVQTLHKTYIDVSDTRTLSAIKLLAFKTGKMLPHQGQAIIAYAASKLGTLEETESLLALVPDTIPEFVEGQLAAVTDPVPRGPWNPPGNQAIPFYIGNKAHEFITQHYRAAHAKEITEFNSTPIAKVLKRLVRMGIGPAENATATATGNRAMRPDIVNLTTREIYEIKPAGAEAAAAALVARHVKTFADAGVAMSPGRTTAVGTRGVVSGPAGHFVFYSPQPGVIVYRYQRGDYVPVPVAEEAGQPAKKPALATSKARRTAFATATASSRKPSFWERMERATGLTGIGLGVYLVISEGSRVVFPPRNAIPIP